jgi:hypothetical protein
MIAYAAFKLPAFCPGYPRSARVGTAALVITHTCACTGVAVAACACSYVRPLLARSCLPTTAARDTHAEISTPLLHGRERTAITIVYSAVEPSKRTVCQESLLNRQMLQPGSAVGDECQRGVARSSSCSYNNVRKRSYSRNNKKEYFSILLFYLSSSPIVCGCWDMLSLRGVFLVAPPIFATSYTRSQRIAEVSTCDRS